MVFLQPLLLWALPLAGLPIVIHLVNRTRHRPLDWAAMIFLTRARRSSTRFQQLKRFLILACRTAILLAFLTAVARPLASGWAGRLIAGPPDTVLLILDRSASMETRVPASGRSRREDALASLAAARRDLGARPRYLLLDSAGTPPMDINRPELLEDADVWAATSTAADIPGLLLNALELLADQDSGRAEIWIASDLQRSNWNPDNERWNAVGAALNNAVRPIAIRILPCHHPPEYNASVRVVRAIRRHTGATPVLDVTLSVNRNDANGMPVTVTLQTPDRTLEFSLQAETDTITTRRSVELSSEDEGWGMVTLAPDANPADNTDVFVYGPAHTPVTCVVAEDHEAGALLALAAAPAPAITSQQCERHPADRMQTLDLSPFSLVIWQGALDSEPVAERLLAFADAGGALLLFPGSNPGRSPLPSVQWGTMEQAPAETPFRVTAWRHDDGPLRHTLAGVELPVADLDIFRRVPLSAPDETVDAWFSDEQPFLVRQVHGRGTVAWCATIPGGNASTLGYDVVLLPLVQRLLEGGNQRFSTARSEPCAPRPPRERTVRVHPPVTAPLQHPGLTAGIVRADDRLMALRRPPAEDVDEVVDWAAIRQLLPADAVSELRAGGGSGPADRREIWSALTVASLLFMLCESALTTTPKDGGED